MSQSSRDTLEHYRGLILPDGGMFDPTGFQEQAEREIDELYTDLGGEA